MVDLRPLVPLALLFAAGCATPYADAAGAFAKTAGDATGELGKVRGSIVAACRQRAEYGYLVKAAGRIELEQPLAASWRAATNAADKDCASEGATAKGFELSVQAIASYAAALGALSGAGKDYGDKAGKLGDKIGEILPKLTGDAKDAKTVGEATAAAKVLVDALTRERKQDDLIAFVREADPKVQTITKNLLKYLEGARPLFESVKASREELLALFELPVAKSPPSAAPPAAPAAGAPPLESRSERYLRALAFFDLAHRLDDENRKTQATLDGYLALVKQLGTAHAALAKTSGDPAAHDFKDALQEIVDLGQQLQPIGAAFDVEKGK